VQWNTGAGSHGDTFYLGTRSVRVAGIDAPETHPPRCASEAALGASATQRLQALLNGGLFQIGRGLRDRDQYDRLLRTIHRDGRSEAYSSAKELRDLGLATDHPGAHRTSADH
jgi:micrococcal nuclease